MIVHRAAFKRVHRRSPAAATQTPMTLTSKESDTNPYSYCINVIESINMTRLLYTIAPHNQAAGWNIAAMLCHQYSSA